MNVYLILALFIALEVAKSTINRDIHHNFKNFWARDYLLQATINRNSLFSRIDSLPIKGNGNITLDISEISNNVLRFVFRETGVKRFELPEKEPFPYHKNMTRNTENHINTEYSFTVEQNPFSFTIKRAATGEILFSTKSYNIIFEENYAEITTSLPSKFLFGLGERTTSFRLKEGTYTIYNRDGYGEIDDRAGGKNRYGSHPMYLMRESNGLYHIIYLRNSFPMDVKLFKNGGDSYSLTYKTAGGTFDFSLFLGDENPETVTKLYHNFIGKHSLPPFWSMGFHQCRWGYKNLDMIKDVLDKYQDNQIPFDTIWLDIDYMQSYVPFTVDESRYNITKFKQYLENYKKKFVMIAEPAMATKWPDYEYLVKGKQLDLFIKIKNKYLLNRVWPGDCYFIDYFHPNTEKYWHEALDTLHDKINFSGVWLDMNELATFEWGQVNEYDKKIPCNDDTKYPYLPGQHPLERHTICPNAQHYGGYSHVQLHNYHPVMQQKLTFTYLQNKFPDQFPFILSRANSVGSGKFSAHWSGDNIGNFDFYKGSLSEVFNFNLFGIPMVGADICGFGGDTPEILCSKFYQIGSLYPFSRSHSAHNTIRKEPWQMNDTLLETSRKSLKFRYKILKFYYSLFIASGGSGTIFKPLFYNFYTKEDDEVLNDIVMDSQFMIGEELMVIPNFNNDDTTTNVNAYFPRGSWYDLRDHKLASEKAAYKQIEIRLLEMPAVFIRGGKTIFTNDADDVMNTYDLSNNFTFLISFDENYSSFGKIPALLDYHSKTKVNNCISENCLIEINSKYDVDTKMLSVNFSKAAFYEKDFSFMTISKFEIYGLKLESKNLQVDKTNLDDIIKLNSHNNFLSKNDSSAKYTIEYVNDSNFIVNINGILKLEKEKLNVMIIFK